MASPAHLVVTFDVDLTRFRMLLIRQAAQGGLGLSGQEAQLVQQELLRFLALKAVYIDFDATLFSCSSKKVADAWRCLLLFPVLYASVCARLCAAHDGVLIDYDPLDGVTAPDPAKEKFFTRAYNLHFGPLPPAFWETMPDATPRSKHVEAGPPVAEGPAAQATSGLADMRMEETAAEALVGFASAGFGVPPATSALPLTDMHPLSEEYLTQAKSVAASLTNSAFYELWTLYWQKRNQPPPDPPRIFFQDLNFYQLFRSVCELGGYEHTTKAKGWKSVGTAQKNGHIKEDTSVSFVLRTKYHKLDMDDFEGLVVHRKLNVTPRA